MKGFDDRRRAILDAAFTLFAARGFHGTTTKAIAIEAGVSEGLIFHHFESKLNILVTLFEEILNKARLHAMQFSQRSAKALKSGEGGPDIEELLKGGFDAIEHAARNAQVRESIRLVLNSMLALPESEKQVLVRRIHDMLWSPLSDVLSPFLEGSRVDPYVFFRMVQGTFMGYILFQEVLGWKQIIPLDAEKYRDTAARALTAVLCPETGAKGSRSRRHRA